MFRLFFGIGAKITVITFIMLSLCLPCFAIQFSQPVEIGHSVHNGDMGGGHYITGYNQIKAKKYYNPYKKRYSDSHFESGYATFDGGNLYLHIESPHKRELRIGASDKKNTILASIGDIYKISTDQGITLYFLTGDAEGIGFTLIGKREDGRFVKYVDGAAIYYKYYNDLCSYFPSCKVDGDSIIVNYNLPYKDRELVIKLKWDAAAQWFSYERI